MAFAESNCRRRRRLSPAAPLPSISTPRTARSSRSLPRTPPSTLPRQLPEQIRAGHTLTVEDEQAIRDLLSRRDTQIRFLYEREKEFSEAMEDMRRALRSATYKLACAMTWPLRKAKRAVKGKPEQRPASER